MVPWNVNIQLREIVVQRLRVFVDARKETMVNEMYARSRNHDIPWRIRNVEAGAVEVLED